MERSGRWGAGAGRWIAVAGARPNFVKLAPLIESCRARGRRLEWIDTGQHTARSLTEAIQTDLELPAPLARLRPPPAGTGRVGAIAQALEAQLARRRPSLVVVLGDVDSTLAAALAAWRLDLPLAHVEAGLRSYEGDMPEERNRVLVDALSDRLYLSEPQARENLLAEGVAHARIRSPGNVMADALQRHRARIEEVARRVAGRGPGFVLVTLHRQANVDDPRRLTAHAQAFMRIARERPVVFPVHPRTRARLRVLGLERPLRAAGVRLRRPLAYLDFLGLVAASACVLTDSGGLQVEAALLGRPCVTARRRTEHQLTLSAGSNLLVGGDPRRLPAAVRRSLNSGFGASGRPRAWDGQAAARIAADWQAGFRRPPRLAGPSATLQRALESL